MTLYIVGTPIGNLSDISERCLNTLRTVDFIAAEDTRVTRKLLTRFDIHTPTLSYHEHNSRERGEQIVSRLLKGETCALVTDAGMPAISDPGEHLVALCHERGIKTEVIPGPSAVTAALAASGMPSARFTFEGFLPMDKKERRTLLEELATEKRTMIFYEAPHKLVTTLKDLYKALGDRDVALVRELTKIHEEVVRTTLSEASARYDTQPPRGEFVLIVKGHEPEPQPQKSYTPEEALALARDYMEKGLNKTKAAKEAARMTGYEKEEIYKQL